MDFDNWQLFAHRDISEFLTALVWNPYFVHAGIIPYLYAGDFLRNIHGFQTITISSSSSLLQAVSPGCSEVVTSSNDTSGTVKKY